MEPFQGSTVVKMGYFRE